jgi:hypothetical protein
VRGSTGGVACTESATRGDSKLEEEAHSGVTNCLGVFLTPCQVVVRIMPRSAPTRKLVST